MQSRGHKAWKSYLNCATSSREDFNSTNAGNASRFCICLRRAKSDEARLLCRFDLQTLLFDRLKLLIDYLAGVAVDSNMQPIALLSLDNETGQV